MINRKSRDEIKRMRHAGHIVALVHKKMREVVEPGISTKELDSIAMKIIKENKATPTFLGIAVAYFVWLRSLLRLGEEAISL